FFAGYCFAPYVFSLAAAAQRQRLLAIGGLLVWALVNGGLVATGVSLLPGVSLFLGGIRALAVVSVSALLARARLFDALRYAAENWLVVHLAFFLPMAATRTVLLKSGLVADPGTIALVVTLVAAVTPLVFHACIRDSRASFLFRRPNALRLETVPTPVLQ